MSSRPGEPTLAILLDQGDAQAARGDSRAAISYYHLQCDRRLRSHRGDSRMSADSLAGGLVHAMPDDLAEALRADPNARATWNDITTLARNEWICWVTSPKKAETRAKRIRWGCESLGEGKRRPCCWPGCKHR